MINGSFSWSQNEYADTDVLFFSDTTIHISQRDKIKYLTITSHGDIVRVGAPG